MKISNTETPLKKTLNSLLFIQFFCWSTGLISIFLHVHPFGAGVEYICSYLQKTIPMLRVTEIEHIMSRFPSVFQQEVVGIGANMERRWKYVGFNVESNDLSVVQS